MKPLTAQDLWAIHGDEMRAELAKRPPLSPDQVREIRAIWLSVITRSIPADRGLSIPADIQSPGSLPTDRDAL